MSSNLTTLITLSSMRVHLAHLLTLFKTQKPQHITSALDECRQHIQQTYSTIMKLQHESVPLNTIKLCNIKLRHDMKALKNCIVEVKRASLARPIQIFVGKLALASDDMMKMCGLEEKKVKKSKKPRKEAQFSTIKSRYMIEYERIKEEQKKKKVAKLEEKKRAERKAALWRKRRVSKSVLIKRQDVKRTETRAAVAVVQSVRAPPSHEAALRRRSKIPKKTSQSVLLPPSYSDKMSSKASRNACSVSLNHSLSENHPKGHYVFARDTTQLHEESDILSNILNTTTSRVHFSDAAPIKNVAPQVHDDCKAELQRLRKQIIVANQKTVEASHNQRRRRSVSRGKYAGVENVRPRLLMRV